MSNASTPGADALLAAIQPSIRDLPESGIVEIVNYAREREGLIQLWIGEGDLPTPAFISDAAIASLRDGQTFYTYQRGIPPLRAALGRYLSNLYNIDLDAERTFVTVGGMQAIIQTVQMLIGAGEEVIVPSPVWPNIVHAIDIVGGVPVSVPITLGNRGWTLDIEALMAACGPKTKAIFVNSPGNPTGWMMSQQEQRDLLDFARQRGLWIIADEVYGRMTYDRDHAPSFLEISDPEDRLIVVNTFSKNWSMTGWRIGWVVAPVALGQVYENLIQYNTSGVPAFLQYGAVAALEQGEPYVKEVVARAAKGRQIIMDTFRQLPRVRFTAPEGAFYFFFSVDGEPDSRKLAFRLADEANVGVAPGTAFGPGGEEFIRICFGGSPHLLEEAMQRMAPALR